MRRYEALVFYRGTLWVCMPLGDLAWRCGKCGRGRITPERKRCRVCRSKILIESHVAAEAKGEGR